MNEGSTVSSPPDIVGRLATIGRIGLIFAGLIALLAGIIDLDQSSIPFLMFRIVGALALIGCAATSLFKPVMRALDLGNVVLAALLAGGAAAFAFGYQVDGFNIDGGTSIFSILAWLLLLGFGGLAGAGLAFGPPIEDEGFGKQVQGMFASSGPSAQPYAAPGQAQPGAPAYAPPTSQPPAQQYSPPTAQPYSPPTAQPAAQATEQPVAQPEPETAVQQPVAQPEPEPVTEPEMAPEGWYPQADGQTARYWDGSEWTDNIRPLSDTGQ